MHSPDFSNTEIAFRAKSNTELWRAVALFRLINWSLLVKVGSPLVRWGFRAGLPLSPLVRWTVFQQFCGGESLEDSKVTVERLAAQNVGAILDYGVEGEKSEAGFDEATEQIVRSALYAGKTSHIPFVVFKMTALCRAELMTRLSETNHGSLPQEMADEWQRAKNRARHICLESIRVGKPVMIDAEESWMQPAIDQLAEELMSELNRDRVWIFTTIQLYRVDRLPYLQTLITRCEKEHWKLGAKLVRGAYMEKERARAASKGLPSPIHPDRSATNAAYNKALELCFASLGQVAFCAGTHNEESCQLATEYLLKSAPEAARRGDVWFAQLYGMSDNLTFNLSEAGFLAAKYLPYGPVHAVLPYLLRRAEENTSVAGQSSRELQLLERELERRCQR